MHSFLCVGVVLCGQAGCPVMAKPQPWDGALLQRKGWTSPQQSGWPQRWPVRQLLLSNGDGYVPGRGVCYHCHVRSHYFRDFQFQLTLVLCRLWRERHSSVSLSAPRWRVRNPVWHPLRLSGLSVWVVSPHTLAPNTTLDLMSASVMTLKEERMTRCR